MVELTMLDKPASVFRKFDDMCETIALFGTSADPPTIGHRAILAWLSQRYDQVFVWAADNPFKSDQTPLFHRQQMLRQLLEAGAPSFVNVVWRPDLSHQWSLMSVQKVKVDWPDAALVLVIGSDILASLQNWHAIDQLIRLVKFVVLHRPGTPIETPYLEAFRHRGGVIEVAEFYGPEVSSSDFRLHHRLEVVPQSVLDYVWEHNLYPIEDVHV